MPKPQKSLKISQPIALEPALRDLLEKHGVRKPPVVDKIETLEKAALVKKWLFFVSPDREDGLTHVRLEVPGPDGLLNFEATALTTALAMTHALCDALENGPQQATIDFEDSKLPPRKSRNTGQAEMDFDSTDDDETDDATGEVCVKCGSSEFTTDAAGDEWCKRCAHIHRREESDDDDDDDDSEELETMLDDALDSAGGIDAELAEAFAAEELDAEELDAEELDAVDDVTLEHSVESPEDVTSIDDENFPETSDESGTLVTESNAIADDYQSDDDDAPVVLDRLLYRTASVDREQWEKSTPAMLRHDDNDDSQFPGWYLQFGFAYNDATGQVTDSKTGEIVWARDGDTSEYELFNVAGVDENHWLANHPRVVRVEFNETGAWKFFLMSGFRYEPNAGEILDAALKTHWTRAFPKLGTASYPDVPISGDLSAALERKEIIVQALRETGDYPTLYVDSDTMEYFIESVNSAGETVENTQPDDEIEGFFETRVSEGTIVRPDRLVDIVAYLDGFNDDPDAFVDDVEPIQDTTDPDTAYEWTPGDAEELADIVAAHDDDQAAPIDADDDGLDPDVIESIAAQNAAEIVLQCNAMKDGVDACREPAHQLSDGVVMPLCPEHYNYLFTYGSVRCAGSTIVWFDGSKLIWTSADNPTVELQTHVMTIEQKDALNKAFANFDWRGFHDAVKQFRMNELNTAEHPERLDSRYPNYAALTPAESLEPVGSSDSNGTTPQRSLADIETELRALGCTIDETGISLPPAGRGRKSKDRIALEESAELLIAEHAIVKTSLVSRNGGELPKVGAGVSEVVLDSVLS